MIFSPEPMSVVGISKSGRWNFLRRDNYPFRIQLTVAFLGVILLSLAVTVGLCYISVKALGRESSHTMTNFMVSQPRTHVYNEVKEMSATITSKLATISMSISMTLAMYTQTLIQRNSLPNSNFSRSNFPSRNSEIINRDSILTIENSFSDFNYFKGCVFPHCPSDVSNLKYPSRVQGMLGSTSSCSTYLFSSKHKSPRNSTTLNNLLKSNPNINTIIAALSVQDVNIRGKYFIGPNSTVIISVSLKLYNNSSSEDYTIIHKQFPGVNIKSNSYDPSSHLWFIHAPSDNYYMSSPTLDPFSNQSIITFSSRQTVHNFNINNRIETVDIVSRADLLLSSLQEEVNSISYPFDGFGALLIHDTLEVLVWGRRSQASLFHSSGRRSVLSDIDPNLLSDGLDTSGTFEYGDPDGIKWIVASNLFFPTASNIDGASNHSLLLLIFAKKRMALQELRDLQVLIDHTTNDITSLALVLSTVTVVAMIVIVFVLVKVITQPLNIIHDISHEIVRIAGESEDKRDYTLLIGDTKASFKVKRNDEIGVLIHTFSQMITRVHQLNEGRKRRSKYPKNPFYLPEVHLCGRSVDWKEFEAKFQPKKKNALASLHENHRLGWNGGIGRNRTASVDMNKQQLEGFDEEDYESESEGRRSSATSSLRSLMKVKFFQSIRSRFLLITLLLLAVQVFIMVYTVLTLQHDGGIWVDKMGTEISNSEIDNINNIVLTKASFISSYFEEATMDVHTVSTFTTSLLDGNLTNLNDSLQTYFPSFSLDKTNYFASPISVSNAYAGYFNLNGTKCITKDKCSVYENLPIVKRTSLLDLILPSFMYTRTNVDFYQIGFEDAALTRNLPYSYKTYGAQGQCFIDDVAHVYYDFCRVSYYSTKCGDSSQPFYPPYDPRCRSWYTTALVGGDPNKVYFQSPRRASNGNIVVTAVTPVKKHHNRYGKVLGVVNSNVLAQKLSDSVNNLQILRSGFCLLINTRNTTEVILHPQLSSSYKVGENNIAHLFPLFSKAEYDSFLDTVLVPIQLGKRPATKYMYGGSEWHVAYAAVNYGTVEFTLLATVPVLEVKEAAHKVENSVNSTASLVVILSFIAIVVFAGLLILFVYVLVDAVIRPIADLLAVCRQVTDDDLNVTVPNFASSLDMKLLLKAFGDLMIALRFASDSYCRGNTEKAKEVFEDALRMHSATGNTKGIGVSHNNLGVIAMAVGDYATAEKHFQHAISICRQIIAYDNLPEKELTKMKRTLSDRLSNLALLKIEQQNHSEAINVIAEAMEEDFRQKYLLGYVIRQGTLAQINLKTGYLVAAERMMMKALKFIVESVDTKTIPIEDLDEAAAAEQIAIFNIGLLREAQQDLDAARDAYLDCLTIHKTMHSATTKKALTCLKKIFTEQKLSKEITQVEAIAAENGFLLLNHSERSLGVKRVALIVDYGGNMSGVKMKSAMRCAKLIFHEYLNPKDSVMLIHFSSKVVVDFPMLLKESNEKMMEAKIDRLVSPRGASVFYDAVLTGLNELEVLPNNNNDWIVLLTEGEDSGSAVSYQTLVERVAATKAGVIIIGIGGGMYRKSLEGLAKANKKGVFVLANGDQRSVDDAFREVAVLIQGSVNFEEF